MRDVSVGNEEELLQRTAWLRRLAHGILRDRQLAEDVSQEVLLRATAAPQDSSRRKSAWLAAVARNLSLNLLRERKRRIAREAASAKSEESAPHRSSLETLEAHRTLLAAVAALPLQQREVVMLRFFEEMDWVQIAARLQIREAAAQMRLHRALLALRARLGEEGADWRAQCLALLPAGRSMSARPALTTGGAIMTMATSWKWAIAASLLILLLAAGVFYWPSEGAGRLPRITAASVDAPPVDVPGDEPTIAMERAVVSELPQPENHPSERPLRAVPVAGRVFHQGLPVAGAEVEARQVGSVYRAITDECGEFHLALDPDVTTRIFARFGDLRGVHSTDGWGGWRWPSIVHLQPSIRSSAGVQVVSAADGQPISGAQVTAFILQDSTESEMWPLPIKDFGRVLATGSTDRGGNLAWDEDVWGQSVFVEVTAQGFFSRWGHHSDVIKLYPGSDPVLRLVDSASRPLAGVLVRYGKYAYRECFTTADGIVPAALGWRRGAEKEGIPLIWVRLPSGRWWCSSYHANSDSAARPRNSAVIELRLEDRPAEVRLEAGWLPEGSWVEAAVGFDGSLPIDTHPPGAPGSVQSLSQPWQRLTPGQWTVLERGWSAEGGGIVARVLPHGSCFGWFVLEQGKAIVQIPPLAEVHVEPQGLPEGLAAVWELHLARGSDDPPSSRSSSVRWKPEDSRSGSGAWTTLVPAGRYRVGIEHDIQGCAYHWNDGAFNPGYAPRDGSAELELREGSTVLRGPIIGGGYRQARILLDGHPVVGGTLGTARIGLDGRALLRTDQRGLVIREWPAWLYVPPEVFGSPTEPVHTFRILPESDVWTNTDSGDLLVDIQLASVSLAPKCIMDGENYFLFLRQLGVPQVGDGEWTGFQDARAPWRFDGPAVTVTAASTSWRFRLPSGRYAFALQRQGGQERIPLTPSEGLMLQPGLDVVLFPEE